MLTDPVKELRKGGERDNAALLTMLAAVIVSFAIPMIPGVGQFFGIVRQLFDTATHITATNAIGYGVTFGILGNVFEGALFKEIADRFFRSKNAIVLALVELAVGALLAVVILALQFYLSVPVPLPTNAFAQSELTTTNLSTAVAILAFTLSGDILAIFYGAEIRRTTKKGK